MVKIARAVLGTFVCVFNRDFSKVLLVRRNEEKRRWGNIGGKVDAGETSIQACVREAREEVGLQLKASDLRLAQVRESRNWVQFVYVTSIDENTKILLNEESDSYEWVEPGNLPYGSLDSKVDFINWKALAKEGFSLNRTGT